MQDTNSNNNNKNISSSLNCLACDNKNGSSKTKQTSKNVQFITNASNLNASTMLYNQIKSSFTLNSQTYNANSRVSQVECKYRSTQSIIYNFLERPHGTHGFLFRCLTFTVILISILLSAFTTLASINSWSKRAVFWYELVLTMTFFIKFLLRVWASGYRAQFKGFLGRIHYITSFAMLIESITLILSILILSFGLFNFNGEILLAPTALNFLRFVQLIRLLNIDRKAQTWQLLLNVVQKHRFELITSVYIGFIILLLSSYLILIFEKPYSIKNNDDLFHSYSDALYFSIITMTTIGYGDRTPRTFYGKIIATSLCILGVAFWTLPGGIIGSGLALQVEQKNKKKQFNRLVPAAANLIQAHWRMKTIRNINPEHLKSLVAILKAFKVHKRSNHVRANSEPVRSIVIPESNDHTSLLEFQNKDQDQEDREFIEQCNPEQLVLLRTILNIKFYVARRKFKLAHKPYDFKDVIEQYTQGNMDILIKIKDLQRKLDQLANSKRNSNIVYSKSFDSNVDYSRSNPSPRSFDQSQLGTFASKIETIEDRISNIDAKLDLIFQALKPQNED